MSVVSTEPAEKFAGQRQDIKSLTDDITRLWLHESVDELGQVLEKATQEFSDVMLQLWWVRYALTWSEPSIAEQRVDQSLHRFGPHPSLLLCKLEALILQCKYDQAAALIEKILANKIDGRFRKILELLLEANYARGEVLRRWGGLENCQRTSRDYQTLCINLDASTERMKRVSRETSRFGIELVRVPGVSGGYLPDLVSLGLTKEKSAKMKGTLGCFMSHVRAWELTLTADCEFSLVIEDDAKFVLPPPPEIYCLLERDFDIYFVNEGILPHHIERNSASFQYLPLGSVIRHQLPKWNAPGAYGYFLSRSGAARLLEFVKLDGLLGDVDWRLVFYSLGGAWREEVRPGTFAHNTLTHHAQVCANRPSIRAYAASLAITGTYWGGSLRQTRNGFEHAFLEAR